MEAWARELAAQGWRQWAGPGCWVTINGRQVWRVELRLDAQPSESKTVRVRPPDGDTAMTDPSAQITRPERG